MPSSSWLRLRSALTRAKDGGGKSMPPAVGQTGRSSEGTVYQTAGYAVPGGARLVYERPSGVHYNSSSFKNAVKKLEEVSLSARGEERTEALARWLTALRDIHNAYTMERGLELVHNRNGRDRETDSLDEGGRSPREGGGATLRNAEGSISLDSSSMKALTVPFHDGNKNIESLNFRDVFLTSCALENIMISFIMEPPSEDEVEIILQIFGHCLLGGPEVHKAIVSGIQDLSLAAYSHMEEVKIAKKELLGIAQDCLSGLKIHAEAERIDAEVARVEHLMEDRFAALGAKGGGDTSSLVKMLQDLYIDGLYGSALKEGTSNTEELLHLANSRQKLMERKRLYLNNMKHQDEHEMTVERLTSLSEMLRQSVQDMKQRMEENRQQKRDALSYRITKAAEVLEAEKAISAEVIALEKRREALEAELKEVMASITVATAKHIHIQEEKEQFDVASSNLVAHLAKQEEELGCRITNHVGEESAVATWRGFLQDTWALRLTCTEQREKEMKDAAEKAMGEFLQIAGTHLKYRKEELALLYKRLKFCSAELETMRVKTIHVEELGMDTVAANITSGKRRLEEKFLEAEAQTVKVLAVVESIRKEFIKCAAIQDLDGKAALEALQELFMSINKLHVLIKDVERPQIDWTREDDDQKSRLESVAGTDDGKSATGVKDSSVAPPQRGSSRLLFGVLGGIVGTPRNRQEQSPSQTGESIQRGRSPQGEGTTSLLLQATDSTHVRDGAPPRTTRAGSNSHHSDGHNDLHSFSETGNDSEMDRERSQGQREEELKKEEFTGWEFDEFVQEPDEADCKGKDNDLGLIDRIWIESDKLNELHVVRGHRTGIKKATGRPRTS